MEPAGKTLIASTELPRWSALETVDVVQIARISGFNDENMPG
jgi:hypothetical protein